MSVQLEGIAFNHDPTSATTDALNIRGNLSQFVTVPEWRRGEPDASAAAYDLRATRGRTLTIQANFTRRDATLATVEVRAITPPPFTVEQWSASVPVPGLGSWSSLADYYLWNYYYYDYLLRVYLWQLAEAAPDNILGTVGARQVTFQADGETGFVSFTLQNTQLDRSGIGRHNVVWRWQYRRGPGAPWTDFATSRHWIYTVLAAPTLPWRQQPYHSTNTQLPWLDVLDYACRWARGTTTLDDAAGRITTAVNDLGRTLVAYDCLGPSLSDLGTPHYTLVPFVFECSAFLDRLRGGIGFGPHVNCSDCAAIVSTFANILGCDLWQSQMFTPGVPLAPFALNPIRVIGSSDWLAACGAGSFGMHEVAWKDACTANDEVFDACLEVDNDADPTRHPHLPRLPINMRFGDAGDGLYRDRLAQPGIHRLLCQPQPASRQRRLVR